MRRHAAPSLLALALASACASTPTPAARTLPRRPARAAIQAQPVPEAPRPVAAPTAPIAVRATAPEPLEFNITASSDLPPAPTSTSQPYARIIDASVATLRPALAECLRALGAPARHTLRVIIDEEGSIQPRPPQEFTLSAPDARCLDGVLRAGRVEPPPPRALPYDLRVDVSE